MGDLFHIVKWSINCDLLKWPTNNHNNIIMPDIWQQFVSEQISETHHQLGGVDVHIGAYQL